MEIYKKLSKDSNQNQLIDRLSVIIEKIQNGSVSIIKQDSVIIQINTNEKIRLT